MACEIEHLRTVIGKPGPIHPEGDELNRRAHPRVVEPQQRHRHGPRLGKAADGVLPRIAHEFGARSGCLPKRSTTVLLPTQVLGFACAVVTGRLSKFKSCTYLRPMTEWGRVVRAWPLANQEEAKIIPVAR